MKISGKYPRVCRLKRSLDKKRLRLAAARARYYVRRVKAEGSASRVRPVSGGRMADGQALLADLADCKTEMDSAGQVFTAERDKTRELLEQMSDPVSGTLLAGVLIEGDGLNVLRHALGMSKQGVYYRTHRAFGELEELMEENGYGESEHKGDKAPGGRSEREAWGA